MLSILLTYHDTLYLITELGLLAVVLLACWLVPRLEEQGHREHGSGGAGVGDGG